MRRDNSIGRFIGMLHRYTRMYFAEEVSRFGIPEPSFHYLVRLLHGDGVSQDELAEFFQKDKGTVARALSRLEETGFIVRRPDANDRRVRRVRLTAKARRIEPQIKATMDRWSRMLTEGFSAREHGSALELLRRMAENARAAVRPKGD